MDFDFSQTYLYKLRKLTTSLDTAFDQCLRRNSDIGLSQFTLLLAVAQHPFASQREIAAFLGISPGAISRQVTIALQQGWVRVHGVTKDKRTQTLSITSAGKAAATEGMDALEKHLFSIFNHSGAHTNLMEHIDLLQSNIASLGRIPPALAGHTHQLPKVADLFRTNGGDINRAAIDVQRAVGHHVSDKWWAKNIGQSDNSLATAKKFDTAYKHYIQQIADIDK